MDIWFSDMDNTLIYSHKHDIPLPKTTAEYYLDREQSFITDRTLSFCRKFCASTERMFVPLTTRTPAQYERILLREKLSYRYALVCNGALLLDNGISDAVWEQESLAMTADCAEPLAQALADLYTFAETEHVHDLRPYMVYAKTEATPQQIATLHQRYTPQGLDVILSGTKLYCLPQKFSKGHAVRRFCHRFAHPNDRVIASGDTVFDVPMLTESDIALYPEELSVPSDAQHIRIPVKGFFAHGLCETLNQFIMHNA